MPNGIDDFRRQQILIGGAWVNADSGETFGVTNPATGETLGTVPKAGVAETRRAIAAAHEAFESFSRTTANERAKISQAHARRHARQPRRTGRVADP